MASAAPLSAPMAWPHAIETTQPADLALIYRPEVNLCVLRRPVTPWMQGFVARLLSGPWVFERELRIGMERPPVASLLPDEVHALPGAEAWLADVEYLVELFRDLFGPEGLGLRLRTLEKAMCPRFHVDNVPVRLICTYGGLGTEWLPDATVDRTRLGRGACGQPDEVSGLVLDPGMARAVPAYAIGLLKGCRWEGNEERGIVHRSPTPTPQQPRRLLLTLDPL
ncbi:Protein of unknown function [Methylomagnum ishizawai]|uniref:DUF1826 domain-containing protein n=1 Tax=Methylomagnum ishizawai TaxID=1760988 RepID=A0A1Y6CYY9_9GAMM|nr:DUF1826 domain-containing protein [Methylomagnum ishizawai]SMF93532.1 Protein of unknown function [Methylomagnum ishizawai]